MDTTAKIRKTDRNYHMVGLSDKRNFTKISIEPYHPITAMTKGWQCCKCKESMYRDEDYCNWNRCHHRRCSSCRSFQV
jgi:hypothetical protein